MTIWGSTVLDSLLGRQESADWNCNAAYKGAFHPHDGIPLAWCGVLLTNLIQFGKSLEGTADWLLSPECWPGMIEVEEVLEYNLDRSQIWMKQTHATWLREIPGNTMPFSQSSCTVNELEGNWLYPVWCQVQRPTAFTRSLFCAKEELAEFVPCLSSQRTLSTKCECDKPADHTLES